jgi:hypothetical protein
MGELTLQYQYCCQKQIGKSTNPSILMLPNMVKPNSSAQYVIALKMQSLKQFKIQKPSTAGL